MKPQVPSDRITELYRAHRSAERRMKAAHIGSFRPMADFDWNWPKVIDRDQIESALTLDFIHARRNLVLIAGNSLGKTMIVKNIAFLAVQAGLSVIFRTCASPKVHGGSEWRRIRSTISAPRAGSTPRVVDGKAKRWMLLRFSWHPEVGVRCPTNSS